jgi:peptide/nickel transport system ATP-binding protein
MRIRKKSFVCLESGMPMENSAAGRECAPCPPPLLELREVSRVFEVRHGLLNVVTSEVLAVNRISLVLRRGETLGLVGESGCGKSTLGRLVVRLLPPTRGDVLLEGRSLFAKGGAGRDRNFAASLPGRLQMIFQDPFSSLNPRLPAGVSVAEPLRARGVPAAGRRRQTLDMLDMVGLAPEFAGRFPHEFSGGQRQRLAIARALITRPDLVVCDEAVSALDASIRAQVLNLLMDMRERFRLTYIFVSHDLDVVGHMSDRVAVMYLGCVVELAARDDLFARPAHPYTAALLASAPCRDVLQRGQRVLLRGEMPSPLQVPAGCPFHPRCEKRMERCRHETPSLARLDTEHEVRCHLYA